MDYSISNRGRSVDFDEVSVFAVGERVVKKREKKSVKRNPFIIIPLRDTTSNGCADQSALKDDNREEWEEQEQEDISEQEQAELEEWKAKKEAEEQEEDPQPAPTPKRKKSSKK